MKDEKIAMVGTPCQVLAATKVNKYPDITGGSPIDIKIGLFCMETFSYKYMRMFLEENQVDINEVKECSIEQNQLKFLKKDGTTFEVPLAKAEGFIRKNCDICSDYTADISDISIGSIGSPKGWSTVIIRTPKGQEIIEALEKQGQIETQDIEEKGLNLLKRIATSKKSTNRLNIQKREAISRPVVYRRDVSEEEFQKYVQECQFDNLESDVISEGACVLCGACEFVCPTNIIKIHDRKPYIKGSCEEGCHACYTACPRTYVTEAVLPRSLDDKPIGDYLDIKAVNANFIEGQDGGAVTAILSYLLKEGIVDKVFIVSEDEEKAWKPKPRLTSDIGTVVKAAGTKYSVASIGFKALKEEKA